MIQIKKLTLAPGGEILLDAINWDLHASHKVALVGNNGCGKTTLIRCILGDVLPISGQVSRPSRWRVGYLPQTAVSGSTLPLWEEAQRAMVPLQEAKKKLRQAQLDADKKLPGANQRLSDAMEEWRIVGGYSEEEKLGETLHGLGFRPETWQQPCNTFSGGWQMRIALVKVLLAEPDISILDEPTNHLDMHARSWLAAHLRQSSKALLVVSHDRYFLDQVVQEVVEIRSQNLHFYKGNYSSFITNRKLRLEQAQASYTKQLAERQKLKDFINRFGVKATKAKQAQDRQKKLDKMVQLDAPEQLQTGPNIRISSGPPSASIAIELKKASIGWPNQPPLITEVDLCLQRGMRLALVGSNGSGKSTLLKSISGDISLQQGKKYNGEGLRLGVFSQDLAQSLPTDHSPIQYLSIRCPTAGIEKVRSTLGAMGLTSSAHERQIAQLSGGEKSRVALAELTLGSFNTLLLDEPTNHLDTQTAGALAAALQRFNGGILIISHDRRLVEETATHLGRIINKQLEITEGVTAELLVPSAMAKEKKTKSSNDYSVHRKRSNLLKKYQREIVNVEQIISELEDKIVVLSTELVEAASDYTAVATIQQAKDNLENDLEEKYNQWEQLSEDISTLQND